MKFCVKCGAEMTDDSLFCPICGHKDDASTENNGLQSNQGSATNNQFGNATNNNQGQGNTPIFSYQQSYKNYKALPEKSTASLILGILSGILGFFIMPLIGLILGAIGITLGIIKKYTAGIVVNIIGLGLTVAMWIYNMIVIVPQLGQVLALLAGLF